MWHLLLILSFILQPFAVLRMECGGSQQRGASAAVVGCCDAGTSCAPVGSNREDGCCTGAAICGCCQKQHEQPAPPPARSTSIDQLLGSLQRPAIVVPDVDAIGFVACNFAGQGVLRPGLKAPQAFFCVWLT